MTLLENTRDRRLEKEKSEMQSSSKFSLKCVELSTVGSQFNNMFGRHEEHC